MDHLQEVTGAGGTPRPRDVELDRSSLKQLGIEYHTDFKEGIIQDLKLFIWLNINMYLIKEQHIFILWLNNYRCSFVCLFVSSSETDILWSITRLFLEPTGSLETALISCDGLYKSNLNVSHLFSFWLVSVIQLSFWIIPTYWSIPKFTKSSIITWGQYKSCLGTIPKIA